MSEATDPINEILVPMDFSDTAIHALDYAKRLLKPIGARLHLLFVDDDPMLMQESTDQAFRDEHENKMSMKFVALLTPEEREQFRTVMAVRSGTAYHEIEMYAKEKNIDLIVMGNIGRSALADVVLGSVSNHIIRHAPCAVLSVKKLD